MPDTHIPQVDVAIIGAGTAGMSAYRAVLQHTPSVRLIEAGVYGTTCARVGCMPSKLLIAAADAAHGIADAGRFGILAQTPVIDGAAVMARVRSERDRFAGLVVEAVQSWPQEHRLHGRARFVDPQTLEIDGPAGPSRLRAGRIVIATGSRPVLIPGWREKLGDRLLVSDDVFSWHDLPGSVAVVGAGVIGLELAQALHRLGVRVHLYGRGGLLGPLSSPRLRPLAQQVLSAELPMHTDTVAIDVEREGDEVIVRSTRSGGARHEARFDWLLCTVGRRTNVDGLQLGNSGLALETSGVPAFDRRTAQAGSSPVFIAGDAAQDRPLLHEAADEGRIAGDNAGRFPDVRVHPRRAPLAVVFSDPQMMIAGASHAALVADGTSFETGTVSFGDQGRSRVSGRNRGALEVYGERDTGRFLGAEMFGPAAEHIGHLLAWSVQRGDTVQQMLDCPFYHPVIEEGVRTALRDLRRALRMGPRPVPNCLDCGPGG
jgi:dihydrolipoamide dehydrogenase